MSIKLVPAEKINNFLGRTEPDIAIGSSLDVEGIVGAERKNSSRFHGDQRHTNESGYLDIRSILSSVSFRLNG